MEEVMTWGYDIIIRNRHWLLLHRLGEIGIVLSSVLMFFRMIPAFAGIPNVSSHDATSIIHNGVVDAAVVGRIEAE